MRSLVLAGGGMRVAWQAGVVKALADEGLELDHVDGTSGGIMTAAMMLSGLSPDEMCERWCDLDVQDFASALPLRDYLKGPWDWPALADADGIVGKVFPHLGIDAAAIRRSTLPGSFNVAEFVSKTCVAVPHTDVDADLLAAGMSLPMFMPPLRREGQVWTDAVWIKDANVGEALRRGADEVWLVWCIGNSAYWGDGPLEQFVHMIEMSAAGALLAELDAAAAAGRQFVLHVVKPVHPLPLDPEFFAGRLTADSLVDMGYRDAQAYLDDRPPGGLPHDETCTAMADPPPGVRFRARLSGGSGGADLVADLTVEQPADGGSARLAGHLEHGPWGGRVPLASGTVEHGAGMLALHARARIAGAWVPVRIERRTGAEPGWDDWRGTFDLTVGDTDTQVHLGLGGAARSLLSVEPYGVHGLADRARLLARVGLPSGHA